MGAKAKIWTSNAWFDPQLVKDIQYEYPDGLIETLKEYEAGKFIPRERLPVSGYYQWRNSKLRSLPNLFRIEGRLVCLSERLADTLRRFELGDTQLIPFPIAQGDRITPILPKDDGGWFLLNIAEVKDCFVLDQSKGPIRSPAFSGFHWPSMHGYDGLAVRADAAAGVDLWMDPTLRNTPFFSDRLAQAIRKGKFGKTGLRPCVVVPVH